MKKAFLLLLCVLPKLVFSQIPILKKETTWIKTNDSIYFENSKPIFLYFFKENFDIALPPMETRNYENQAYLKPDSSFWVEGRTKICLQKTGLYFAQTDTSQMQGTSFLVVPNDFPKFSAINNLIYSLAYISTNDEMNELKISQKKIDLDRFWLNIGGNAENTRLLIRKFYENIRYANENFTDYKMGWKTDRGMIYTVFGKPDQIQEKENYQKWTYFNWNIDFEFVREPNFFTSSYLLIRKNNYQKFWNFAVVRWRQGIN